MKMHGLGDGPYWMISYAYFLFISVVYMLCFVIFGSVVGKFHAPLSICPSVTGVANTNYLLL